MALVVFKNDYAEQRYRTCRAMSGSLEDCVERMKRWTCESIVIQTEFCSETDFYFVTSSGLNGGIVWHGPQGGFQIHT